MHERGNCDHIGNGELYKRLIVRNAWLRGLRGNASPTNTDPDSSGFNPWWDSVEKPRAIHGIQSSTTKEGRTNQQEAYSKPKTPSKITVRYSANKQAIRICTKPSNCCHCKECSCRNEKAREVKAGSFITSQCKSHGIRSISASNSKISGTARVLKITRGNGNNPPIR